VGLTACIRLLVAIGGFIDTSYLHSRSDIGAAELELVSLKRLFKLF